MHAGGGPCADFEAENSTELLLQLPPSLLLLLSPPPLLLLLLQLLCVHVFRRWPMCWGFVWLWGRELDGAGVSRGRHHHPAVSHRWQLVRGLHTRQDWTLSCQLRQSYCRPPVETCFCCEQHCTDTWGLFISLSWICICCCTAVTVGHIMDLAHLSFCLFVFLYYTPPKSADSPCRLHESSIGRFGRG